MRMQQHNNRTNNAYEDQKQPELKKASDHF